MKLIKCSVENFGALSGFKMDFTDGLCVIKEDNGFGKSTLAAFVKAMFYGLPVTRKADINENERLKYDPWQGGNYGGSLDFECEKGTFRIERFFGNKAKDDSFKLYDLKNGTESTVFSDNIGNELFSIDAESFEKSVFLPQQKLEVGMNASINAKLTGLVEDNDDIGNFDRAMAELDKQQKARGVKGRLDALNKEIALIERDIVDKRSSAGVLDVLLQQRKQYKSKEAEMESRLEQLRREISVISDLAAAIKDNERRRELSDEIVKCKGKIEIINKKYKVLPTESEITSVNSVVSRYTLAKSGLNLLNKDTHDEQRFSDAQKFFVNGIPTDEQLAECKENLRKYEAQTVRAETIKTQINEIPAESVPQKGKLIEKAVLLVAALFAVTGIFMLFINLIVGVALLGVGIISAGVAGFLMLKGMITSSVASAPNNSEKLSEEYATCLESANRFKALAVEFLKNYSDDEPNVAIEQIAENLKEYNTLKTIIERKNQQRNEQNQILTELQGEIEEFFEKVTGSVPENLTETLDFLREDIKSFDFATKKINECKEKLSAIPQTDIPEGVEAVDREALICEESELSEKLDAVRREITSLQSRITVAELSSDALQDFLSQLDDKNEQKAELSANLEVVRLTEQFLKEARDGLSSRYMTVLKNKFKEYTSLVCGGTVGEFMLDNSLSLGLSRDGGIRESECFSEGYRDMLDICMRLSLADALYDGEKPMLILDDPFVNLDDQRVQNALLLLSKLAENRQIIYLTCHNSRVPE